MFTGEEHKNTQQSHANFPCLHSVCIHRLTLYDNDNIQVTPLYPIEYLRTKLDFPPTYPNTVQYL